jgi:hypothetical protein
LVENIFWGVGMSDITLFQLFCYGHIAGIVFWWGVILLVILRAGLKLWPTEPYDELDVWGVVKAFIGCLFWEVYILWEVHKELKEKRTVQRYLDEGEKLKKKMS